MPPCKTRAIDRTRASRLAEEAEANSKRLAEEAEFARRAAEARRIDAVEAANALRKAVAELNEAEAPRKS